MPRRVKKYAADSGKYANSIRSLQQTLANTPTLYDFLPGVCMGARETPGVSHVRNTEAGRKLEAIDKAAFLRDAQLACCAHCDFITNLFYITSYVHCASTSWRRPKSRNFLPMSWSWSTTMALSLRDGITLNFHTSCSTSKHACQVCASPLLRGNALATLKIAELSLDARLQQVALDVAGIKALKFSIISPCTVARCVRRDGCLCTTRGSRQEEKHGANEGRTADVVDSGRDFAHGWHVVHPRRHLRVQFVVFRC